jgi:nicotinamidase-related amidase
MSFSEECVRELARRAYAGDANFPLVAERAALLVIDMQDEFVRPGWTAYWVPAATSAVPRIGELIACCRRAAVPVIYTAFGSTHRFLDRPRSGPLMPGRYAGREVNQWFVETRIWEKIAPQGEDIVLLKSSYGAFYDTPLENILKNLGRDTVIICGTLTNFCCGVTARQAYERGFYVVFGSDVTATDDPELHEAELKVLRKGFARVLSGAQISAALSPA